MGLFDSLRRALDSDADSAIQVRYDLPVHDAAAAVACERVANRLGLRLSVADNAPDMEIASHRLIAEKGGRQLELRLKQRAEARTEVSLSGAGGDVQRFRSETERLAPLIREEDLY